jgi:uncharacterized protein
VRKLVLYACLAAFAAYAATGAVLWAGQRRLIFEPKRSLVVRPGELGFRVVDVTIPVGSEKARAWWMPATREGAKVILYFHGNDGNVSTSLAETALLRELGYAVMVVDYRGYGESDGTFPSETTVYEDAEAALGFLTGAWGFAPRDVVVYGHSLGAAVAIDLAVKHPDLGGLIVESGFTSIYDMAELEQRYSIYPLRLLLNQRFDSIAKVPRLALPVLYIHGTADEIVPYRMGVSLYERSGGRKRLLSVPGGDHDHNAELAPAALGRAIGELTGSPSTGELAAASPDL